MFTPYQTVLTFFKRVEERLYANKDVMLARALSALREETAYHV